MSNALQLHKDSAKHFNFNITSGESTGIYRFKIGFSVISDMSAEIKKAVEHTLADLQNAYSFFDDTIIIVSVGSEYDHIRYVTKCLKNEMKTI